MPNTNCLEGMRCPKCGSEGPFDIEASAVFRVYDSGTDEFFDVSWEKTSPCVCIDCGHEALVCDFSEPSAAPLTFTT